MEQNQWERLWTNLSKISYNVVARSLLRRRGFRSCQKKKLHLPPIFWVNVSVSLACFLSPSFSHKWHQMFGIQGKKVTLTISNVNFLTTATEEKFYLHPHEGQKGSKGIADVISWRVMSVYEALDYIQKGDFFFFNTRTWQLSSFFMKGAQRWSRLGFLGSLSWHKSAPRLNNLILSILGMMSSALTLVIPQK